MTYFADLSEYTYRKHPQDDKAVNVGWLDLGHEFPIGETPLAFKERLFKFCLHPVNHARGFHPCPFCTSNPDRYPVKVMENKIVFHFGSAEIRVITAERTYAAPNMIYHYVVAHNYLPPEEFVEAVLENLPQE